MSLVECYTPEQREMLGIASAGSDLEPVLPHLRLIIEIGGRALGAGAGFYVGDLFKDQREYIAWISLSTLTGYVLLNVASHYLTDRLWGVKEHNFWHKRLMRW